METHKQTDWWKSAGVFCISHALVFLLFLLGLPALGFGQAEQNEQVEQNMPDTIDRRVLTVGKYDYDEYCAHCHGKTGQGDGEVARALQFSASNLSQLQKQNNGKYPFWRVFRIIDGRDSLEAHGREMPVWGRVFQSREGQHPVIEADIVGRILSLNFYLQTLQAK